MSDRRDNDLGFTLMEVLVAFAILALSLGGLYQLYGGALARHQGEAARIEALRVAQSTLAELGTSRPVTAGMTETFHSTDERWVIHVTSEPLSAVQAGAAAPGTWITVAVAASGTDTSRSEPVALTTYMLVSPP